MNPLRVLGLLACLQVVPTVAYAQATAESLLRGAPNDHHLRGRVAMDPAFMFGVGYVRGLDLDPAGERKLGLHVDIDAVLDFSSWDLTAGASARILDRPGFDVMGSVDIDLKLARNEVHTALAYGYRAALLPGYYGRNWYVAAELGVRGNIATTIWQGADYLALVPDAQSGTYRTRTTFLSFGASVGFRFCERYFAGLRAAYRAPITFDDYGPWVQPMTMGIEFGGTIGPF
jgi:hypothetical protein